MFRKFTTLFISALVLSGALQAAQNITSAELVGSWKISDVKIANTAKAEFPVSKENCYLCDLYNHNQKLVFAADGKVAYMHDANPYKVTYSLNGNILMLSSTQQAEVQLPEMNSPQRQEVVVSTQFEVSISNGVLTLIKRSNEHTETYFLTK